MSAYKKEWSGAVENAPETARQKIDVAMAAEAGGEP